MSEYTKPDELAATLRVSSKTITRWHQNGQLPPGIRIGSTLRWESAQLQRWLAAGCRPMLSAQSDEGQ